MQTAYELDTKNETIRPVAVEPPYSVGVGGQIVMEGNPNKVFSSFSEAKKALVKCLTEKKDAVQQQITAARKLTRGKINLQAVSEIANAPGDARMPGESGI